MDTNAKVNNDLEGVDLAKKGNLKLSVFSCFRYGELKKICDYIEGLGYECYLVDNGNMVFQKIIEENTEFEKWDEEDEVIEGEDNRER